MPTDRQIQALVSTTGMTPMQARRNLCQAEAINRQTEAERQARLNAFFADCATLQLRRSGQAAGLPVTANTVEG